MQWRTKSGWTVRCRWLTRWRCFMALYYWCFHAAAAKSLQLYLTRSDPMDCSLPGSSISGIFQARVLEGEKKHDCSRWPLLQGHSCFVWLEGTRCFILRGYDIRLAFHKVFPWEITVHSKRAHQLCCIRFREEDFLPRLDVFQMILC